MSQSQQVYAERSDDCPETLTSEQDAGAVLEALDDDDCRCILEATSDDSLTANEISETCDLPLSTAYRKIDRLADAGLLSETLRIRRSGKHVSEYTRDVEDVVINVSADGDLELSVTHREPASGRAFPPRLHSQ